MACPDEITDCELMKLGDSQLLRKLLRLSGECLSLSVSATLAPTAISGTGNALIQSAEAAGSQTLAGLYTAYTTWIAANSTKKILRETPITGGDGIPGILITYTT